MDTSLKAIVESLIIKTTAEEANWRVSSAEGEFSLFLNHSTITIGAIPSFSETTYVMRIYNDGGNEIAVLDTASDMDQGLRDLIEKLFFLAQEAFLHSKKTIDSVLNELGQPGIVGSDTDPKELPF